MVQYPCSGVGQTKREVFILHADTEEDARFVHEVLLPSLRLPPDSIALSSRLPPGRTIVEAVEQAIATSRVTLLVLSSAFLRESWSSFGEVLASHFAVSGHALLVPLVISDCELPPRLQMWVGLDLRSAHRQHLELARLHELLHAPPAACCASPAEVAAPRAAAPAGTSACAWALVQAPLQLRAPSRFAYLVAAVLGLILWLKLPSFDAPAPAMSPLHARQHTLYGPDPCERFDRR